MISLETMRKTLHARAQLVENFLQGALSDSSVPPRLYEACQYSLNAGGKRLRPVLCLSCASMCGLAMEKTLPFASAIEMIHTYSLIHDDLPAMDDDDLRRGKPSNHKAFDEATAILAGDGLLTDAFAVMTKCDIEPASLLAAVRGLAEAAGSRGMVGGQMWDMLFTGQDTITVDQLRQMHAMKTGALLRAACVCGATLAGAGEEILSAISEYGKELGIAFQIADDILDVTADTATLGKPAASDLEQGKNTYPRLFGLDRSRELAVEHSEKAQKALQSFSGEDAEFLKTLAVYTVTRVC